MPLPLLSRAIPWRIADPGLDDLQAVARINAEAIRLADLSDDALSEAASELRETVRAGASLDLVRERAFALVKESARRTLGISHYDEQILAGLILSRGELAEMATGEGKTLVMTLPAFLHSLEGRGVHAVTVNSYLATRDFEGMQPVFERLGATVALLPERVGPTEKGKAYAADITYGVGYEFAFDYLRDQLELLARPRPALGARLARGLCGAPVVEAPTMQRGLHFAIVDEVDSVLIDEARTPLIISGGQAGENPQADIYRRAREVAATLEMEADYFANETTKTIVLTGSGEDRIDLERPDGLRRPWKSYVEQALRASVFFQRNVHYLVREGKVQIIDEFTGRSFADRTWRDGLHQAVEAQEDVTVTRENESLAQISRQRFYGLYEGICGMSGTVAESAGEFRAFYELRTVRVPLHAPSRQAVLPSRVFVGFSAKLDAVAGEILRRHSTGQPVLVGTRTVRDSEELAERLMARGAVFRLLNAKQDADEAAIIACAGQRGAITLATNMAGRGAHIPLQPGVAELGGLHVIGLDRHEARRIDRQLSGRSARQGQPGSAQFFLAAHDHLLETVAPETAARIAEMPADEHGEVDGAVASLFDAAQREAERRLYATRKQLLLHDEWLDETRRRLG